MLKVIWLALAVAAVSYTITRSLLFAPARAAIEFLAGPFIGELFSCPYCFSHWVTLAAVLVYRPRLGISPSAILDGLVAGFAMIAISAVVVNTITRLTR